MDKIEKAVAKIIDSEIRELADRLVEALTRNESKKVSELEVKIAGLLLFREMIMEVLRRDKSEKTLEKIINQGGIL